MTANFQYNDVFTSGNITSSGIITGTSGVFNTITIGSGVSSQINSNTGLLVYPSIIVSGYGAGTPGYFRCGSGDFTTSLTAGSLAVSGVLTVSSGMSSFGQRAGEVFTVYGAAGVSGLLSASGLNVYNNTNTAIISGNLNVGGTINVATASGSLTVASGGTSSKQRTGEIFTTYGGAGVSGLLSASGLNVYNTAMISGNASIGGSLNVATASGSLTVASGSSRAGELFTVYGTAGISGLLTIASGLNIGTIANTGVIAGQSTSSTIPALSFQSVTANHTTASHVIFDFRKNISTRILYIAGEGSIVADNGSFVSTNVTPAAGNAAFIGNGMRRYSTANGFDFAWGESITSTTEPGIDLFPIGGTHISSGILFRLSKDTTKTDVAMIINGSGNIGIGTNAPNTRLHVVGNTNISGILTATSGSITTLNTVPTYISPSGLGTSQGDWNPGIGDVIRASASVSGVAISGIVLGNEYTRILINVGTIYNITLKNEASTATSGYRIITPNGGDYIVQPTGTATILYDIVDNRWRVL